MHIILYFLYRSPYPYYLFGFERAIHLKYQALSAGWCISWFIGFLGLILTRNVYFSALFVMGSIAASYDTGGDGLITKIHESRVFGTWRGSTRAAYILMMAIICFHFLVGPFGPHVF